MLLCLDVGNTNIYAGLRHRSSWRLRFRYPSAQPYTSDQLGIFLSGMLREHDLQVQDIEAVAMASVVPSLDYSLRAACRKYLQCNPFVLQAGVKTGLKIMTANPAEVGADLVAAAIAAQQRYPGRPHIVVDFGTATTFTAVNAKAQVLGAVFMPGVHTAMQSMQQAAAKLSAVAIVKPSTVLGRNTGQAMQSGLYHMQLGAVQHIVRGLLAECFSVAEARTCVVIATGGFSHLYKDEQVFTAQHPELVLEGIALAYTKNIDAKNIQEAKVKA